jgi:hypothetical protein
MLKLIIALVIYFFGMSLLTYITRRCFFTTYKTINIDGRKTSVKLSPELTEFETSAGIVIFLFIILIAFNAALLPIIFSAVFDLPGYEFASFY